MAIGSTAAPGRPSAEQAGVVLVLGSVVLLFTLDHAYGSVAALAAAAWYAWRARMVWLCVCALTWALVFLAVLVLPGPYDSWAGRAAVPVLAGYALCFLGAWALGRRVVAAWGPAQRPELRWPNEFRLRIYLLALLALGILAAVLRFRGAVPPLFAADPDAARAAVARHANIVEGLLSEAWTLGMAVSLLRLVSGARHGRWLYPGAALVFTFGAALGASKNSVLVGVVPAVVAALSVRRPESRRRIQTWILVGAGLAAVAGAVALGGQRTLAGNGVFEDEFRARYGDNVVTTSVASLDLSLSSSAETFGRLWAQRDSFPPRWGAYTMRFLGSPGAQVVGRTDLYGITGQLSMPYYMNTATFVAIPLLDWGPLGAAVFLVLLGLAVGVGERSLEGSSGPAQQLGRAFIVYFAAFGIYELYPAIYPTWLAIVPGLWLLYRLSRAPA
jgi:hypothetical protein